uniref:Uncharacterized protein n=1 Tax=Physcomitrium patens TaxID=3218 RepID=A0A7I3YW91_PHYPA
MARPKRRRAASPSPEEAAAVTAPSKSRSNRKEALMKSVVQQPSKRNQKDGQEQGEGVPSGSAAELKSNPHKLAAPLHHVRARCRSQFLSRMDGQVHVVCDRHARLDAFPCL